MMQDIQRICVAPTAEDREWFPDLAGRDDWRGALKDIWANYRDESFVRQFLSPHLIRKLKLFVLGDKAAESKYRVEAIHDADGYRRVRSVLAENYDVGANEPDIQVVDVDLLRRPRADPAPCRARRRSARRDEPRAGAAPHSPALGLRRAARGRRGGGRGGALSGAAPPRAAALGRGFEGR